MFQRRPARLFGATILSAGLALAGQSSFADDPTGFTRGAASAGPSRPTVVEMGGGDRVGLTPVDGVERTVLEPLPRPDGTTPGLIVSTDGGATTVQATDSDSAPTLVAGTMPEAAEAADDLVELRFETLGRDGRPAIAHVNVFDVETGAVSAYRTVPGNPAAPCTSSSAPCILLPPGTYSLMALVTTMPADRPSAVKELMIQNLSLVGDPEVNVSEDRTVTFDAREAERVEVRTPGDRTEVAPGGAMELGYSRTAANGRSINVLQRPPMSLDESFYQQPTAPVTVGDFESRTRLRLEAPDIELIAAGGDALHPDYYDRVWFSDISSQFPVYDGLDRLRVVDVGQATASDLTGRDLSGAIAVAERSDALSVADQSNAAARTGAELVAIYNDGPGDNGDPNGTGSMLEVPTVRLARAEGLALLEAQPGDRVTVRGESVTPYVYDLVLQEEGGIPEDLAYTARTGAAGNLSTQVREFHGQPSKPSAFSEAAYAWHPGDTFSMSTFFPLRGGAQTRTEHRIADPDVRWSFSSTTPESTYNTLFPRPELMRMQLQDLGSHAFAPGETVRRPVGAAPITAAPNPAVPIERSGDRMRLNISGFVDADGNFGRSYSDDSGMRTLLQIRADGMLIGETTAEPRGTAVLPPGESRMSISFTSDNPQSWAELSTHTDTRWTFDSEPVPAGQVVAQPVIVADYDVDVDLRNRAWGRELGLDLGYRDGADAAAIRDVTMEASYDDGETWRAAIVQAGGDGGHHVVLPPGHGYVSLRVHAADDRGSALDQRIIRAWWVR